MMEATVKYAVFIRNVMIGRNGLHREILVNSFSRCGAMHVKSVLATGNLIFEAAPDSVQAIVQSSQEALRLEVGLTEPMFTRSLSRLSELADLAPFASPRSASAYERCVSFLPPVHHLQEHLPYDSPRGDFAVLSMQGTDVFSTTWLVGGRPGQPGKWIEQRSGGLVTTRNWNTIARLLAM